MARWFGRETFSRLSSEQDDDKLLQEDDSPVSPARHGRRGAVRAAAGTLVVCAIGVAGFVGRRRGFDDVFRWTTGGSVVGLAEDAWLPAKDPKTGRTYFYNALLHQTSWTNPAIAGAAADTYTYDENMNYGPVPGAALPGAIPQAGVQPMQPGSMQPAQPNTQEIAAMQAQAAAAASSDPVLPPTQPPTVPTTPDPLKDRTHGCPGSIAFGGVGDVQMVNAKWNQPGDPGGVVEVQDGNVVAQLKGRTYFAEVCTPDKYDNNQYLALQLLGRTIRYTTDLSAAQCGCNAALYLSNMRQHTDASMCYDFYCDASSVCSGTCAEVDLQEANSRAWFSTMHMSGDSQGLGGGYGFNRKDWNASTYGPGARCIDTTRPFEVAVSFPVDGQGVLEAMEVRLTQGGSCPEGVFSRTAAEGYLFKDRQGKAEVSEALATGMTPIISYWSQDGDEGMGWMDGLGPDAQVPGPCKKSEAGACGQSVSFTNFVVMDYAAK